MSELERRLALVVDLGTTGAKVGVATFAGRVVWCENHDVASTITDDGGATQDAGAWWTLVCDATRRAMRSGAFDPARVEAVGLTGQWASTVPVDEHGAPVGPCLLWMDSRAGRLARAHVGGWLAGYDPKALATWVRRTGGAPSLEGNDPLGHRLWLEREAPDVWARARWLLEPVDYVAMRLTGVAAASRASMTASWLTDNRDLSVDEYDPVLLRYAGTDGAKLPPLRPTMSVIAPVRADVAADLGLPERVHVVAGLPDLHTAALGSGAVEDQAAHLALSTTSWISCHLDRKKTDAVRQMGTVPGVRPDRYLIANNHETSGRALQWLRDVLGDDAGSYAQLDALAASSSPGAGGVIFTPWLAGERSPVADRNARAGFHNVSLTTTRADLVRAVLEGVAFNDRWLLEAVERFAGARLDPVRIIGGGSSSALWCRIHADVMDRTIEQVAEPLYAGLRGAALAAALALGAIRVEDVRALVPVAETFRPDPATRAAYDRLYAEFPGLYKTQKALFARLNGRKRANAATRR
jgi:xylulokinase